MRKTTYKQVLKRVKQEAWERLKDESSGHDYWHVCRVAKCAKKIAKIEKAELMVVELAAWLHDIKTHPNQGHEVRSAKFATRFLSELGLEKKMIAKIASCIKSHRFSSGRPRSLEARIIQDADKIDALGAIGIARAFAFGGQKKSTLYNPELKPLPGLYAKTQRSATSINHFYEKLLRIRPLLHTEKARQIARCRERYMKNFLRRFFLEWEGEK